MLSRNAFGNFGVYQKHLIESVGGFNVDQRDHYGLLLRCAMRTSPERIRHIPKILCHTVEDSFIHDNAMWHVGALAIKEHLTMTGVAAEVKSSGPEFYQVEYATPSPLPRISILIPTTGRKRLLVQCLQSLFKLTTYQHYEICLLINQKDYHRSRAINELAAGLPLRLLVYPDEPFNYSRVNNWGASQTSSDLLCFLNDDTELITPNWLEKLAARATLPDVAAVGAMLFYPNKTIQRAGIILGLGGVAGHACHELPRGQRGYFDRARLEQDVSCVTGACMMVRSSVFNKLQGFNEELAVAYNDVDLCIRIRAAGWRIIWTPTVELYHRESASTGRYDSSRRAKQFAREVAWMRERWGSTIDRDPYYNPNLSLQRAFHLAFPPRV
jgi:GT2 family glycosyltransferase